jgi:hypothetical protein
MGILLARSTGNWRLPLAVSPILSLGANYLSLTVVNYLGVRPNLAAFGIAMTSGTLVWLWRIQAPLASEVARVASSIVTIAPATIVGGIIFRKAYSGYVLIAPNQDSVNHNRWIARIAISGSALMRDSEVSSPVQRLGSGRGFYPFAWHTTIAIASKLASLPAPKASFLSTVVFWTVALPAGVSALALFVAPKIRHVGPLAALLVQLYPLTPGVPLSWGSMTSCVGVALLPSAATCSAYMLRETTRLWTVTAIWAASALFFIHTPEAATLLVLLAVQFLTIKNGRVRKNLMRLTAGMAVFLLPAMWIFRGYIFGDHTKVRELFGATQVSWWFAIRSFFEMSINTNLKFTLLTVLFIAGLVLAIADRIESWVVVGTGAILLVYLTSGAGDTFLASFRIFTAPWYASYERTLWVAVPFAALFSAYAVAKVLPANLPGPPVLRCVGAVSAAAVMIVVVRQQVRPVVGQLRSGPDRSAMIGGRDLGLIERSRAIVKPDQIAIGFDADGTIYPYAYEGVRVTAGAILGNDGNPSAGIREIMTNIHNLCASQAARDAFATERVAAVFVAKRGVWGQPLWTEADIRELTGLKLVENGDFLALLAPDFGGCP